MIIEDINITGTDEGKTITELSMRLRKDNLVIKGNHYPTEIQFTLKNITEFKGKRIKTKIRFIDIFNEIKPDGNKRIYEEKQYAWIEGKMIKKIVKKSINNTNDHKEVLVLVDCGSLFILIDESINHKLGSFIRSKGWFFFTDLKMINLRKPQ